MFVAYLTRAFSTECVGSKAALLSDCGTLRARANSLAELRLFAPFCRCPVDLGFSVGE
jgi:hypothetical protein